VFELISELEQLLTCGSVDQDVQRREYLLRWVSYLPIPIT
jgi:hypothetical protein